MANICVGSCIGRRGIRIAQFELIDVERIELIRIIGDRFSLQKLRLHLHICNLGDSDGAALVERQTTNLTVKQQFLGDDIFSVDMPEDGKVFRAILQREGDCHGITVGSREISVLRNKIKRRALLQHCAFFIYIYFHYLRDLGVLLRINCSYSS